MAKKVKAAVAGQTTTPKKAVAKFAARGGYGKGGGGKSGAGNGSWVWMPSGRGAAPQGPKFAGATAPRSFGRRISGNTGGKLSSKVSSKGSGKSKAKGESKYMDKLGKIDASLKVWVGGLSPSTTWKQLEAHFATVKKPHVTEIMRKGKACVAYKTEEDVSDAIASLNGSELNGQTIDVDVWTKPEKKEKTGEETPKAKKVKKHTLKVKKHTLKVKVPLTKQEEKIKEKLKGIDASLKVWVGGLKPETPWKAVEKHFATMTKPKVTSIMKKGTACLAYESIDQVTDAIATFNGSELNGHFLEVDTWEKPERKKKAKEVA